ncbi:hypothetical protein ACFFGQ_02245 [Rufibacter quisquiliarum]
MKKAIQLHLILVLLLVTEERANACECRVQNLNNWMPVVEKYMDKSSLIFIGKISPAEQDDVVSVKVIDVFKGNIRTDSVFKYEVNTSCPSLPKEGLSIIYAIYEDDGTIEIPSCGITRSIDKFPTSQIPPFLFSDETPETEIRASPDRGIATSAPLLLKNWMLEYALLNAYRNSHPKQPQPQTPNKDYLSYLAVALSIIAVLAVFFRKQR